MSFSKTKNDAGQVHPFDDKSRNFRKILTNLGYYDNLLSLLCNCLIISPEITRVYLLNFTRDVRDFHT